jgi:hypothetical protein
MDAFATLVDDAAQAAGYNDYQLSAAIGLMQPGNRVFGPKQVGRLRSGRQRHYDRQLVQRLIEVLDLDPLPTWEAAGLWPPGYSVDDVSELLAIRSTAVGRIAPQAEGASIAAAHSRTDQAIDDKRTWRYEPASALAGLKRPA